MLRNDNITITIYSGIEIYVSPVSGEFGATINEACIWEKTLDELKSRIEKELKADLKTIKLKLECWALVRHDAKDNSDYYVYGIESVFVEGISRTDGSIKLRDRDEDDIEFLVPATGSNGQLLQKYADAKTSLSYCECMLKERRLEVSNRWGGRIRPSEYPGKIKNLQARYDAALRASNSKKEK